MRRLKKELDRTVKTNRFGRYAVMRGQFGGDSVDLSDNRIVNLHLDGIVVARIRRRAIERLLAEQEHSYILDDPDRHHKIAKIDVGDLIGAVPEVPK